MELGLIVLAVAVVLAAAIFAFARPRPSPAAPADPRLDTVLQGQATIAEQFRTTVAAQATLAAQIDALKEKMGESLAANAQKTGETLGGIQTRLIVIDEAQKNISALSGQVVPLQQVLSNKQSRGAFGQVQMEEIVRDGLPSSLYEFQFTLSNKNRPDCIIRLPGQNALLVIDSKFPLEGFDLLRRAGSDEEKKVALAQVRVAVGKHIADMAEKHLIPGEVQTPRSCSCPRNPSMPICMTVSPT